MALTLHNRSKYPYFFAIIIVAVIIAWLRFAGSNPPELLVSILGGIASVAYFMYRQHVDETRLFKELFAEFNLRYDGLNDDLNKILFGPSEGLLSADERERLFSYFNLCAEEYFFYEAGYIDRLVWESWYRGMKIFFRASTYSCALGTRLQGRFVLWFSTTRVSNQTQLTRRVSRPRW